MGKRDTLMLVILKVSYVFHNYQAGIAMKTPERRQWRRFGVFMLTLNIFHNFFLNVFSIFGVEQGNADWENFYHSVGNLVNKGLLSLKSEEYGYTPISVLYTLCVSLVLESRSDLVFIR